MHRPTILSAGALLILFGAAPQLKAQLACEDKVINPVDLGTILPPADWLLLASGQKAIVEVAAISYHRAVPDGSVKIWLESSKKPVERSLKLDERTRKSTIVELGPITSGPEQ